MTRLTSCAGGVLLNVCIASLHCLAAETAVWQIGQFNDSSLEFRQGSPRKIPSSWWARAIRRDDG